MDQVRNPGHEAGRNLRHALIGKYRANDQRGETGCAFLQTLNSRRAPTILDGVERPVVSSAERVVFVDSHQGDLPGGFLMKRCDASKDFEFTSHVLPPSAILY